MLKEILILNPVYVTLFWAVFFIISGFSGKRSHMILGYFMTLACILYVSHAAYFSKSILTYSYLDAIYIFCNLSVYPTYYLYVRSVTRSNNFGNRQLVHFIIPLVFSLVLLYLYSGLDQEQRLYYVRNSIAETSFSAPSYRLMAFISKSSRIVFGLQVIFYLFLSERLIKAHEKFLNQVFSNTEKYRLNWVRLLSVLLIMMALTSLSLAIIGREKFANNETYLIYPSILVTVFIFTFGYIGSRQQVFAFIPENFNSHVQLQEVALPRDIQLKQRFDRYFAEQRPFLDPELKIWDICRDLGTNRTYISRIINEDYKMNFNRFINHYRIKTAKEIMEKDPAGRLSYENIAEMAGFGSINSFFRAFREFEKITPGRFREKLQKQS